jgi:hypothetical protein
MSDHAVTMVKRQCGVWPGEPTVNGTGCGREFDTNAVAPMAVCDDCNAALHAEFWRESDQEHGKSES